MIRILSFLIYSNVFVSLCVLSLGLSSSLILQATNSDVNIFLFFSTLFIYNFQRIVRIQNGLEHIRKEWSIKHQKIIYFLMGISFIICLIMFLDFKFITQLVIAILALTSIFYPTVLRQIPILKIFIISLVWALSTTLILALENNILLSTDFILHSFSRFLFVFAITIPFDIRDLKYDINNLITLPLFFGTWISKIISLFCLFICCLIIFFQYLNESLISSHFYALILLYFLSSIFICKSNEEKEDFFYSFWVESLSIMSYVFLIFMLLIF